MKTKSILFALLIGGALLGSAWPVAAQSDAKNGCATVVRVNGQASYNLGDDKWTPLVAGKVLAAGSLIRTGHNGSVDVVLGRDVSLPQNGYQGHWTPANTAPSVDYKVTGLSSWSPAAEQNVVRIMPDSTLGLDKLTVIDTGSDEISDTELDLKQGKIFASVKKISGASQYFIKLPNGIAGVRGTQFGLGADGSCDVFHSTGGGVVISLVFPGGGAPQTIVVPAGYSFNSISGQLAGLPGDVLSFLKSVFSSVRTLFAPLSFAGTDGTQCYVSPVHGGHGGHGHHGGGGGGD
jgi:FecR protein